MLDLRLIRTDTDAVRAGLARRGADLSALDEVLALDEAQRTSAAQRDELRNQVKKLSQEIGAARKAGDVETAETRQADSRAAGERAKALAAEADEAADRIRHLLLTIPNLPSVDAPEGKSAGDNVVLRVEAFDPEGYRDHQRLPHWEIGEQLGILDNERAVKLSGSMFTMYRGWGARLLRAMVGLSLDLNGDAYEEVRPPTLVTTETMVGTGHLPKFADEAYHIERDDLWAIPTAEVPLTSLGRDEIFDASQLPLRFMAYTSCFRREAGSAGRDTRGLLRAHEFDKVELLGYAADAASAVALQEDVLARAERVLQALELPYRVLDLCAGDLGSSAARTWDVEVYSPALDTWLEASSVSWFGDYQARRANVRFRIDGQRGTEVCQTVNGSAMGWPRTIAAFLENHRQPDGSIRVPDALAGRLGRNRITAR